MDKSLTSTAYDGELRELQGRLLTMGALCEGLIRDAWSAMESLDASIAREVCLRDRVVDGIEKEIDELAVRILALRQPAGRDLRLIIIILKVVTDLERIGDEATNIAERVLQLEAFSQQAPSILALLKEMAERTVRAVTDALHAFVASDVEKAQAVLSQDDAIDALYGQVVRVSMDLIRESPSMVQTAMCYASTSKYLERIGDHANNIALFVIMLESGEDLRHPLVKRGD